MVARNPLSRQKNQSATSVPDTGMRSPRPGAARCTPHANAIRHGEPGDFESLTRAELLAIVGRSGLTTESFARLVRFGYARKAGPHQLVASPELFG